MINNIHKLKKLVIITVCLDDWGGSEELWAKSIPYFFCDGVKKIILYKNKVNIIHPQFKKLQEQDVVFREFDAKPRNLKFIVSKTKHIFSKIIAKLGLIEFNWNRAVGNISSFLKTDKPDFVIISQGINFDGLSYGYECLKQNIPYILISHKAVDFYWPSSADRTYMKETLLNARLCLFVSKHNLKITEEQFGIRLPNSSIIINPVKTKVNPLPFPIKINGIKLACIGRLFLIDKGQDILLRILATSKWRERNVSISLLGKGEDEEAIKDLIKLFGLKNISFNGYSDDMVEIWKDHHALILPSRSEGLPLTIIEAMSFARPVIASNAGGNSEVIQDGITGFIGEANETSFEIAMETAWQRIDEWEAIGIKAAEYIEKTIPSLPEKIFAELVVSNFKSNE